MLSMWLHERCNLKMCTCPFNKNLRLKTEVPSMKNVSWMIIKDRVREVSVKSKCYS